MPASHVVPLEGRLSTWGGGLSRSIGGDLPDLLVGVCRRGKTGQLKIHCSDGERTLFIKQGRIIFAESTSKDDRLGEYLLRKGRIRLSDYYDLSKKVGKGKRLGSLLVENGLLELDELVPSVMGQVRRIVVRLFRQVDFTYEFTEKKLRKEPITLDMRLAELVLEGVQEVDSWSRLFRGIGDLTTVYKVREAAVKEFGGLKLDPDVLRLLTLLDQHTEVAHAGAKAKLSDFRCAQFLWAFRSLDWIEPVYDVKSAAVSNPNASGLAEQSGSLPKPAQKGDRLPTAAKEDEAAAPVRAGSEALAAGGPPRVPVAKTRAPAPSPPPGSELSAPDPVPAAVARPPSVPAAHPVAKKLDDADRADEANVPASIEVAEANPSTDPLPIATPAVPVSPQQAPPLAASDPTPVLTMTEVEVQPVEVADAVVVQATPVDSLPSVEISDAPIELPLQTAEVVIEDAAPVAPEAPNARPADAPEPASPPNSPKAEPKTSDTLTGLQDFDF